MRWSAVAGADEPGGADSGKLIISISTLIGTVHGAGVNLRETSSPGPGWGGQGIASVVATAVWGRGAPEEVVP
ncbi:MAG TPA: hypothetical protein VMT43_11980 [Acidimicrobiales bacterium]|nr:hypothetical protein [Acidimicrobiales bacterium]